MKQWVFALTNALVLTAVAFHYLCCFIDLCSSYSLLPSAHFTPDLLTFHFQVMKAVVDQYRLPAPLNCPPALHALMLQCWQADRQDRLGFDSLLSSLDRLIRHPASLKAEHSR